MTTEMLPQRPYLLRSLYDWIVDSGCTPHLLVDAEQPDVSVPTGPIEDGRIVLNVAPSAVRNFVIADSGILFDARFGGAPFSLTIPIGAVLAIYARENGAGMAFDMPEQHGGTNDAEPDSDPEPPDQQPPPRGGGHLKVVK